MCHAAERPSWQQVQIVGSVGASKSASLARHSRRMARLFFIPPGYSSLYTRQGVDVASTVDPYGGLSGTNRDAAVALTNIFESYGLGTLAPAIIGFLKQGYSPDTISLLLQDTPEYKQRFAANDARRAKGLPVLSPAEYLATEASYRDIMSQAGLPVGFYDNPQDFQKFLAQDMSPTELQGRVQAAAEVVNAADPNTLSMFSQYGYTNGDLIAYALDPTRAEPLIQKQFRAAQIGGAAKTQGLAVDAATSERLASQGFSAQQAQAGFGQVAAEKGTVDKLNSIYGADVTQDDLVSQVFGDNAEADKKVKKLASQERASFGGSSGQSRSSLSKGDAGRY